MKDSKITLSSILLTSALLCATLSGCKSSSQDNIGVTPPLSPDEQSYEEVYLSQIEYYEQVIKDLEDKLLAEKEHGYISNTEYQLRIDELQSSIALLNEKIESINKQSTSSSESHESEPQNNNIYNNEENRPATESLSSKGDYKYKVENGCITITAYTGNSKTVIIPSTINGTKVTGIGEEAFKNCTAERIVISDTITHIDWFAFRSCRNLCEITIPASVISIAHGAFDMCRADLIIKCKESSYAEAYAKSWGFIAITE